MSQQEQHSSRIIVTGAVLACLTVAVVLWGHLSGKRAGGDSPPLAPAATPLDGGAPAMRSRIDDYIGRVAQEDSFEALAAGLNQPEGRIFAVMMYSDEMAGESMFEACLANRRLARLFAMLKERDDADAACRKLFEDKLAILRDHLMTCIQRLDKKGGPKLVKLPFKEPLLPIFEDQTAVSAALFLSGEFCAVEEVLRQLDAWYDLRREVHEAYEHYSSKWEPSEYTETSKASLERDATPEARYQLNLFAAMLDRRFGIKAGGTDHDEYMQVAIYGTPEEKNAQSAPLEGPFDPSTLVPPMLFYRRVPFCAWNADTNPFDGTHVSVGVPIDTRGELGEYRVYVNFMVLHNEGETLDEARQRVLSRLREELIKVDRERREARGAN